MAEKSFIGLAPGACIIKLIMGVIYVSETHRKFYWLTRGLSSELLSLSEMAGFPHQVLLVS
jgi:hypothetical protein